MTEPTTTVPTTTEINDKTPAVSAPAPTTVEPVSSQTTSLPTAQPAITNKIPLNITTTPVTNVVAAPKTVQIITSANLGLPKAPVVQPVAKVQATVADKPSASAQAPVTVQSPALATAPLEKPVAVVESKPIAAVIPAPVQAPVTSEPVTPPIVAEASVAPPVAVPAKTEPESKADASNEEKLAAGVLSRVQDYVLQMKPGVPMNVVTGLTNQSNLWAAIRTCFDRLDGDLFTKTYDELLGVVTTNSSDGTGVFNEKYLYRFFTSLKISQEDAAIFRALLHLMVMTADPAGRQVALKRMDVGKLLNSGLSSQAVKNITKYYKL